MRHAIHPTRARGVKTTAMTWFFVLAVAALSSVEAQHRKFYPDDPLLVDDDTLDVPEEPAEVELSDMFDRFGNIMADLGSRELTEAENVNTLDEVPNSSWFTNRHGVRRLTIPELIIGPNTLDGPDTSVPWRIFRSKIGGLTGLAWVEVEPSAVKIDRRRLDAHDLAVETFSHANRMLDRDAPVSRSSTDAAIVTSSSSIPWGFPS